MSSLRAVERGDHVLHTYSAYKHINYDKMYKGLSKSQKKHYSKKALSSVPLRSLPSLCTHLSRCSWDVACACFPPPQGSLAFGQHWGTLSEAEEHCESPLQQMLLHSLHQGKLNRLIIKNDPACYWQEPGGWL